MGYQQWVSTFFGCDCTPLSYQADEVAPVLYLALLAITLTVSIYFRLHDSRV